MKVGVPKFALRAKYPKPEISTRLKMAEGKVMVVWTAKDRYGVMVKAVTFNNGVPFLVIVIRELRLTYRLPPVCFPGTKGKFDEQNIRVLKVPEDRHALSRATNTMPFRELKHLVDDCEKVDRYAYNLEKIVEGRENEEIVRWLKSVERRKAAMNKEYIIQSLDIRIETNGMEG
ncbi:hypothetical protein WN48_01309 [Eufriesea mexicana]|uniref:Uncharacterized protein n=1 Tax=Eufriesea mexicana TaxID=516756 RepID=A0A310SM24_9HYME|nr:hypothetical protein WN48_01309 [Eufriesea mexicana]